MELRFQTYIEPTSSSDRDAVRTYLLVFPSKTSSFRTFFTSVSSFASSTENRTAHEEKVCLRQNRGQISSKLHGYSHLSFEDMRTLCQRGDVLTPVLEQALRKVAGRCSSCKQTGRPANSRKISFSRILGSFNKHVQVDFLFAKEFHNISILHIVDVHTGLSTAHLMPSREMTLSARALEVNWINLHGSPAVVSADPEFFNSKFAEALRYFDITFQPRPARRHNKLGVVERKNSVVRTLIQRLLKDADYFDPSRDRKPEQEDILSRAVYLSNILYGSRSMSSFELAGGYTPALVSLPQAKVPSQLFSPTMSKWPGDLSACSKSHACLPH